MLGKTIFYLLPYVVRRRLFSLIRPQEFKKMQEMRTRETSRGYSYRPFDQKRCIFVHIPKTAGVSVARVLFGNLAGHHTSAKKYQFVFAKREFMSYFKFSFVRNPWDRLFSAYNFLNKGGFNQSDRAWAEANIIPYRSFDDFVKNGLPRPDIQRWKHFQPQYSFLFVPNSRKLQVNFLGFFENLQADFQYLADRLGIVDAVLGHENSSNSDRQVDYRDCYTAETRAIVKRVYKKDIDIFGYSFDNSSISAQLASRRRLLLQHRF